MRLGTALTHDSSYSTQTYVTALSSIDMGDLVKLTANGIALYDLATDTEPAFGVAVSTNIINGRCTIATQGILVANATGAKPAPTIGGKIAGFVVEMIEGNAVALKMNC